MCGAEQRREGEERICVEQRRGEREGGKVMCGGMEGREREGYVWRREKEEEKRRGKNGNDLWVVIRALKGGRMVEDKLGGSVN